MAEVMKIISNLFRIDGGTWEQSEFGSDINIKLLRCPRADVEHYVVVKFLIGEHVINFMLRILHGLGGLQHFFQRKVSTTWQRLHIQCGKGA